MVGILSGRVENRVTLTGGSGGEEAAGNAGKGRGESSGEEAAEEAVEKRQRGKQEKCMGSMTWAQKAGSA